MDKVKKELLIANQSVKKLIFNKKTHIDIIKCLA